MMILRLAPLKKNFYGFTHFDTPLTFAAFAACDKGYIMVGAMFRAFLATFLGGLGWEKSAGANHVDS